MKIQGRVKIEDYYHSNFERTRYVTKFCSIYYNFNDFDFKKYFNTKVQAAKMRSQSTSVYEYVYPLLLLVHQRFYIYLDERRKGDYTKRMQCGISHVEI